MNRFNLSARASLVALSVVACGAAQAAIITDWDFGTLAATAPDNTPAPTTGSGSATSLGMTNTYTETGGGGDVSTTYDDITKDTNSTIGNEDIWRIRGAGSTPGNGWSINAPEYTQGAEFDVSTAGFSGVVLSFNWASTAQGIMNMQVQYNTNINNTSGWTNVGSLLTATIGNSSTGGSFQTDTVNFSALGITSVANDPNFGVRLVSAYNTTLGTYASATLADGQPVDYNNNSGNWRFADVQIDGTVAPVPLPASVWLMLSGLGALAARARRRVDAAKFIAEAQTDGSRTAHRHSLVPLGVVGE
jgi:hypothetical protein